MYWDGLTIARAGASNRGVGAACSAMWDTMRMFSGQVPHRMSYLRPLASRSAP